MRVVFALIFGPIILAVVVAALIRWRTGARGEAAPGGALRAWTIVAATIPLLVAVTRTVLGYPSWMLQLPRPVTELLIVPWFVGPIVLALVALVLLLLPLPVRRAEGAAEVSRRTMWTFTSTRLLLWLGILVAVVVGLTVAAGLASEPDEVGRYRMYWVRTGEMGMGTEIYGWYYSIPALVVLAVLLVLVLVALVLVARPPLALGEGRERDVALRRLRSRNVLLVALGGVAGHLGAILRSLSNTSSVRSSFPLGDSGVIAIETPFAALTVSLLVAGFCLLAVALTAWLTVLLSVVPVPFRARAKSRTGATAQRP